MVNISKMASERNLEFSTEKTRIVHIENGFDFLGFNVRTYKGKALIKPAKTKVLAFCKRLGEEIKALNGATQSAIIAKLNPILRGFANYYRGVVAKKVFSYIDYRVWQYLWRWAKRRHPQKSTRWVKDKYFHRLGSRSWVFSVKGQDRRGQPKWANLYSVVSTPIVRHIKVKGNASPDDSTLKEYWEKRSTKAGKEHWARGSKYQIIANNQKWKCPVCGEPLFNGEDIETHHIIPVAQGGSDDTDNLVHLHKACHKQVHSGTRNSKSKG